MKLKIMFIIFIGFIIMPFRVNALSVSKANISSNSEQTVGEYFNIDITANFSDINQSSSSSDGIYTVVFELETDDTILEAISGYSNGYDTVISRYDGKYYVVSTVNDSVPNKCLDGFLSCGNYNGSVKFFVKNTTKESVDVKLTEFGVIGFRVDLEADYYDNPIESTLNCNSTKHIKIKSASGVIKEPENSAVQNTKPVISTDTKITTKTDATNNSENNSDSIEQKDEQVKSTNKYLEYLKIKDYDIKFEKDKLSYNITVPKDLVSIEIDAKTLDEKATFKIVGYDKLEKKENTVKVIVTAENGDRLTYFINVIKDTENKESFNKVTNKLNNVIIIVVVAVLLISILIGIISYRNKKKLIKMIDES